MKIALVYGTAAPAGRLSLAMQAFADAVRANGANSVGLVDLSVTALPFAGTAPSAKGAAALDAVMEIFAQAQAAALFMPVYRAAPPGALKNLLDLLPVSALENKPVAQISMGASPHHYLANPVSLAPVLHWFGALPLPGLYLTGRSFDDGALTAPAAAELRDHADSLLQTARRLDGLHLLPRPLAASSGGG